MKDIKTRNLEISIEINESNREMIETKLECRFKTFDDKSELVYNITLDENKGLVYKRFLQTQYNYAVHETNDTDQICEVIFDQVGVNTKSLTEEEKNTMTAAKKAFKEFTERAIKNATEETASLIPHKETLSLPIVLKRTMYVRKINQFLKDKSRKKTNETQNEGR